MSPGIPGRRKGWGVGGGQDNSSVVVAQGTPSTPASFLLPSQKSTLGCAHKAGIKRRRAHTPPKAKLGTLASREPASPFTAVRL